MDKKYKKSIIDYMLNVMNYIYAAQLLIKEKPNKKVIRVMANYVPVAIKLVKSKLWEKAIAYVKNNFPKEYKEKNSFSANFNSIEYKTFEEAICGININKNFI